MLRVSPQIHSRVDQGRPQLSILGASSAMFAVWLAACCRKRLDHCLRSSALFFERVCHFFDHGPQPSSVARALGACSRAANRALERRGKLTRRTRPMVSHADAHCNAGRHREKRDVEHIAQRGARNHLARLPGWRTVARWCGARSDSGPPVGKEACGSRRTGGNVRISLGSFDVDRNWKNDQRSPGGTNPRPNCDRV